MSTSCLLIPHETNLKHLKDELLCLKTAELILDSFVERAEAKNASIFGKFFFIIKHS